MRNGRKTTELWVGVLATIAVGFQQALWPDAPLPKEAFITLVVWVVGRMGSKALTEKAGTKRAWKTSEFWVTMLFTVVRSVYPELPPVVETFVWTYILGRPAVKALPEAIKSVGTK